MPAQIPIAPRCPAYPCRRHCEHGKRILRCASSLRSGGTAALVLCLLLASVHATGSTGQANRLGIDPASSRALFSVKVMGFMSVSGRFHGLQGQVRIDPRDGLARVDATIPVNSVVVDPSRYRARLLSPRFFDAVRFPDIRFVSRPMPQAALLGGLPLSGRLTLHGVTRPIVLRQVPARCPGPGLAGCILRLEGWIDRTRFGMHAYRALVSRRVQLALAIRLIVIAAPPASAGSRAHPARPATSPRARESD